jgi:hypothetical protein
MARKSLQATSNASNGSTLTLSSDSSQVSESAKAIFNDDKALARPFKKVKTCPSKSTRLESPTIIDQDISSQDAMNDDNTLTLCDSPDIEIVEIDPKKELGTFVEYYR